MNGKEIDPTGPTACTLATASPYFAVSDVSEGRQKTKAGRGTRSRLSKTVVVSLLLIILAACGEYSVPITERPTRKIDTRLIAEWVSIDARETIKIRELNDSTYIVSYNGILFRAFHSDVSGVPFLSVQELETRERNYSYLAYRLSADSTKLYVRLVNEDVIPKETHDLATLQQLLKRNLQNAALFHREEEFTKKQ